MVVLTVLGAGYFYAARGALLQLLPEETFKRWRNLWLAATLVLFLSHSIWIWMLVLGAILLAYRRREAHLMGLYLVLLFVAPPAQVEIPGLGIIDHLWVLDHYRFLALTLLLPAALSLIQRTTTARLGSSPVDWMVLGYLSVMSLLAFREGNVTSGFRTVLSLWVDIFLPYYVTSRSLQNEDGLRQALTGYVIAAMILALIAIFEVARNWKMYSAVLVALGVGGGGMSDQYLYRSGLLRPNATVGNSIVLGYVLVVGLGFFLYLKEFLTKPLHRFLGLILLTAGIVASLSRGPWVGAILLCIIYVLIRPRPVKRLLLFGVGGMAVFLVLSQLPGGQLLIDMLPVVGTIEQGNVEYRSDLLAAALPVIERNLLFGSYDYLEAPELQVMMQGEGIIDLVNTYIGVALYSGVVGLTFFVGAFLQTLRELRTGARIACERNPEAAALGQSLFATVTAIMMIIYTASSISAVPVVYWLVIGLSVAYAGLMKEWARNPKEGLAS